MSKKKRFLSIFAILFALVFALALVFGAACGKKNKEDDSNDTEPEITEPEDDGKGDDGSGSGSGSGDTGSGSGETGGDSGSGSGEGGDSGSGSGGSGDAGGSGSGAVEIPEGAQNVYSLSIDFSNAETYAWITGTTGTTGTTEDTQESYTYLSVAAGDYTTGLLTYHAAASSISIGKEQAGALYTGTPNGDYMAIDLKGLDGDYITVEAAICANTDSEDARSLVLGTTQSTSNGLATATSTSKADPQTLDYTGIVDGDTLYLVWTANIQISSLKINLYGDKEPDLSGNEGGEPAAVAGVTLSTDKITRVVGGTYNITASVTTEDGSSYAWTGSETWASSNTSVATVASSTNGTATITAVAAGTATVTLAMDESHSASCTVVVSAATTADPTRENGYTVDFSQSDTYKWIETVQAYDSDNKAYEELESGKTFSDGLLTLVTGSSMKIQSNALCTGGTSSASNRYIKIDLSAYAGKSVSISANMLSGASGKNRSLVLGTSIMTAFDNTAEGYLTSASSSSNSSSGTKSTLSYEGTVSEGEVLYLSWVGDPTVSGDSGNIKIYDLNVTVTDAAEAGARVALATEAATLADGTNTATFENGNITMTVTPGEDGNFTYVLAGEAATMTAAQAEVFWNGVAKAHDAYVIITITLEEGETVSWTASDGVEKSFTYEDLAEDDGVLGIIIRISGVDATGQALSATSFVYTIKTSGEEGSGVTHTVDVTGVTATSDHPSPADPEAEGYVAAENIYWNWDGIEDRSQTSGTIDVYILCTKCGGWVEYTTNYTVDQDDPESFTASVEAGGYTFTGTQKMEVSVSDATELEAALSKGGYIALAGEIDGAVTVKEGVTATLDLAGKTISAGTNGENTVTVEKGASLTISDSGENGKIANTYKTADEKSGTSLDNAAAIYIEGTLVVESGTIESSSIGVKAEDGGQVTINGGTITSGYFAIWLGGNGTCVTINGGTVTGTDKGIVLCGDGNYGHDGYQTGATQTLNVNGGTLSCGKDSVITTLGITNSTSSVINITGGTLTGADIYEGENESAVGTPMPTIYIASGTLNISGDPTITGSTPVEIRGGTTTISGGTFTVEATAESSHANNSSGATSYGYAISVFPYGSGVAFEYTNDDGTKTTEAVDNTVAVYITGGTFTGDIYAAVTDDYTGAKYSWAEYTFEISGGSFSTDPSDYLAENYMAIEDATNNGYVVEYMPIVGTWTGSIVFGGSWTIFNASIGADVTITVNADGEVELAISNFTSESASTSQWVDAILIDILEAFADTDGETVPKLTCCELYTINKFRFLP